jgi:tetratricopeptide (TPR) repeat protein
MSLLKPVQLVNSPKKHRIGPDFQGGLVLVSPLEYDQLVSLGTKDYYEFEVAIGVWDSELYKRSRNALLKLETHEPTSLEHQENILQAVLVLHDFVLHKKLVEKLKETHWLVHVHPCNTRFFDHEGNPKDVELTFVRKTDFLSIIEYTAPIPDPLIDMPCDPKATSDLCLSSPLTIGHTGEPTPENLKSEEQLRRLYRHGVELEEAGELLEALRCYGKLTEIDPSFVAAFNNIGCVCMQLSFHKHAVAYYKAAITLSLGADKILPNLALAYAKMAFFHLENQDFAQAKEYAYQSVFLDSDGLETPWVCYFQAEGCMGNSMRAFPLAKAILAGHPDWKDLGACVLHFILDNVIPNTSEFVEIWAGKLDLEHEKKFAHLYFEYLKANNKKDEASALAETFTTSSAKITKVANLFEKGDPYGAWELCLEMLERGVMLSVNDISVMVCNSCLAATHCVEFDGYDLLETHLTYDKYITANFVPNETMPRITAGVVPPEGVIKVGYVSSDFKEHAVLRFAWALLTKHDRKRFQVHIFSSSNSKDATTDVFKASADFIWHDIATKGMYEVIPMIRNEGINILVDLAAHTGGNRLELFAFRCAPVQVTMIGYAATTGIKEMDYKIVDHITDPEGLSDEFYTEKLKRVPNGSSFLCYTPPWFMPEPLQANKPHNSFVFGSFAKLCKLTTPVLNLWCEILEKCPNSILALKSISMRSKKTFEELRKKFTERGLKDAEKRVVWIGSKSSVADHLKDYNYLDCCLDTFPYTGTTTTCEALCMGVPVITKMGVTHRENVSASIIYAAALPERWVTPDCETYLEVATSQYFLGCRDTDMRTDLSHYFKKSQFMNSGEYAEKIEALFEEMLSEKTTKK